MRALVRKREVQLPRRGKCEAYAAGGGSLCPGCRERHLLLWRRWYGWSIKPAACETCCERLLREIENGNLGSTHRL
jgi:hypothetical protein